MKAIKLFFTQKDIFTIYGFSRKNRKQLSKHRKKENNLKCLYRIELLYLYPNSKIQNPNMAKKTKLSLTHGPHDKNMCRSFLNNNNIIIIW